MDLESGSLQNPRAMAHATASAPTLVLRLQPKLHPNMDRMLEYCAGMDARACCCILKPNRTPPDTKDAARVTFAEPAPAHDSGELPVLLVPDDIYEKLRKNFQRFGNTIYHSMMFLREERENGSCNGHFDAKFFSALRRAELDPTWRKKLEGVFDVETYWHDDESCMADAGDLAADHDNCESKEDKYLQREHDIADIVFAGDNMRKMTAHELFSEVRKIEGEFVIIELQVNTVGPWTLYNSLRQYLASLLPTGSDIEGWDLFEETCMGERPETPVKRRRLAGGSGAAGGSARP